MTCGTVSLHHIQALLVIVVEKFFLKIPRVAGKIERFYINIVQGKSWPQRRRRYTNVVVKGTLIGFFTQGLAEGTRLSSCLNLPN
jgi:hypothetical protein